MNVVAKVGGRRLKGDNRDTRTWTGVLNLKATREGDQYVLAAMYEMLIMGSDRTAAARLALDDVAKLIKKEYYANAEGRVAKIQ